MAQACRLEGVTEQTNVSHARAWSRWNKYLQSIGVGHDPFLDSMSRGERHRILSAFAQAVRDARFSPARFHVITCGVVNSTLSHVASAFRSHDRPDPRLDVDGEIAFILRRQLKGYTNTDPGKKPQQAISSEILERLYHLSLTDQDQAITSLLISAFFFAMRSCEYCTVTGRRRTKIIRLGGIRFYLGKRLLPHCSPILHKASSVTLTFEYQKNESRNESVTAHCTYHAFMCPVIQLAKTVRRIRAIPGSSDNSPINLYAPAFASRPIHLHATHILNRLRTAVDFIGPAELGFTSADIGLHSIRSGAAMSMYLQGIPVYVIMLLGRWCSDAFLRYIRRNVQEFSAGVSRKMIANPLFFTVPSADREDPRACGHRQNLQHNLNLGRNAIAAPAPALALWA